MTDRIEKKITLRAPRARVWRAIADRTEFGTWFGAAFPAGAFVAGEKVTGKITHPPEYAGVPMVLLVVDVKPETLLSYRWHPYELEGNVDFTTDPTTLVTFTLEEADGGTLLTIVESGFDKVPLDRRAEAFRMNDQGWTEQITNIERHVTANR